jgi:hypothetical protein
VKKFAISKLERVNFWKDTGIGLVRSGLPREAMIRNTGKDLKSWRASSTPKPATAPGMGGWNFNAFGMLQVQLTVNPRRQGADF